MKAITTFSGTSPFRYSAKRNWFIIIFVGAWLGAWVLHWEQSPDFSEGILEVFLLCFGLLPGRWEASSRLKPFYGT